MQSLTQTTSTKLQSERLIGFRSHIPASVLLVAVLAALLHVGPYWRAQSQVPPGWTFTGNLSGSPDMMQYRVWSRQTHETGILVTDKFTSEPNEPHLLVVFYYAVGKISAWTGLPPEFVYAYAGPLFAFGFTILLFIVVRHFLRSPYRVWSVFLVILMGGGLGAHLNILSNYDIIRNNFILKRTLVEGLWVRPVLENHRGAYVFISLFDTHYLLFWLVATATVFSLYFTLQKFSLGRLLLTAALYAAATLLHLYEGVTLIVIAVAVIFVLWRKGLVVRSMLVTLAVCALVVVACLTWQVLLYRSSGLPLPSWRAENIPFSTLLIAYPLAWGLIAWGIGGYWQQAGLKECFLLGWALGCTALTLSGPFYPYPDRGTMTLQIPIYTMAGAIYFSHYKRITPLAAVVAILVLAATPAWLLQRWWEHTAFDPNKPYIFMSVEHREIVDLLAQRASQNDILIVDKSDKAWLTDDLWLAPEYPGKLFCGHFFLTVDYDRKCAQLVHFFNNSTPEEQAAFLQNHGIRFVYVNAKEDPHHFERVPGLALLKTTSVGSLFEYTVGVTDASR